MLELGLRFPDPATVVVSLNEDGEIEEAASQPFRGPLDAAAQKELHWYLEVYPAQYMTEVDDDRATRIAAKLPTWGAALFNAMFAERDAQRLFNRFQDRAEPGRLITVSSAHPSVLAQPWELLKDPRGTYVFLEDPRISVRRRLGGAGAGRKPFQPQVKGALHLLFVVSRPSDAPFIDPQADSRAVMDALDKRAPERVTVEFLRPATLEALVKRLEDEDKLAVDVLHFDGHGAYDAEGRMADAAKQTILSAGFDHLLREAGATAAQQGFLLFEKQDGKSGPVPASLFGEMLNRKRIGLVVLSACQSAMVGGEDAMGSVAARLTDAGLPAVLAMTHSVLVQTTRALFEEFYDQLAGGRPVGTSLDNARRALYARPHRGQRRRGDRYITLELQDWFLPALYQPGRDTALLTKGAAAAATSATVVTGLPPLQPSGFYGRRRELWQIERWFVGGTRRLVVHGFGGEGKTYLAAEAGRWLVRTGLFQRVCFVDYESLQGIDARGWAVNTLATALAQNLLDAEAATAALQATPMLLILDNLEAVPAEAAAELLMAAKAWSEAGESRVLVATRQPDLGHPDWPAQGSNRCRYLDLKGLQPDDALDWFQELMTLPPEPTVTLPDRDGLTTLFAQVDFHPLSIGVLAEVLKTRRIAEVGEGLERNLRDEKNPLVASLNLSIERLKPVLRASLARLGVFQGGALEVLVTEVTQLSAEQWAALRVGLEQTGLIRAEALPGYKWPYLRFHPTLAPALRARLGAEDRTALTTRHREVYYQLSAFLYAQDPKAVGPIRAIARAELPNLMAAVNGAIDAGVPEGAYFADIVSRFLGVFGLARDLAALVQRAQTAAGDKGSDSWYHARSQLGEQLLDAGRFAEAEKIFGEVLAALGEVPSFNRCTTLGLLARCHLLQGRPNQAETLLRHALTEIERLEQTPEMRRLNGTLLSDLGESLWHRGDLAGARGVCEAALAIARKQNDVRNVAVRLGQLSAVAVGAGDLDEAEAWCRETLKTFQALGEPASVATGWLHLGIVYQEQRRWEEAEHAFREAARLNEERGDVVAAAGSWDQLAQVMKAQNRFDDAEQWYGKALVARRAAGARAGEAITLNNLANLLSRCPGRLVDARCYAEQALAIKRTLDPAAAEIWMTYNILARIADAKGNASEARAFRCQERQSFAAAPASREMLRRYASFIAAVAATAADPARRPALETYLDGMIGRGWGRLVAALRRLLDGERDENTLCAGLGAEDTGIIRAALAAVQDPELLQAAAGLSSATDWLTVVHTSETSS